jgi:putative ABC transport system permease protein
MNAAVAVRSPLMEASPMEFVKSQLKQVMRRLTRTPMFTAITLLTLAAGVGANIAVFSVVEGVLLKPLPYPHSEQLVGVWHNAPGAHFTGLDMGPSNYFIYRDQGRAFQDIGLYDDDSVSITGSGEPEQVRALDVTDGTLPILGIPPELGRWFNGQDDLPSSPQTAMLMYGYWQRKFGGDRNVIGKTILVNGAARQIIGVMPERFHFLDEQDPALLLPLRFDRSKLFLGNFSHSALARLKPGVTIAEADADVARMIPIVMRSFPPPPGYTLDMFQRLRLEPDVDPLKQDVVGDVGKLLWVLMGGIGMVLLIACANVANLLLVRTEGRQQELAIRSALGATQGRIAGELLFESLFIGLAGGVLGLGIAYGALRFLVALAPAGLPRLGEIGIDVHVLLFTLGIALFASLLFGSIPVLKYAGARLGAGLREGGRTLSQSRQRHRARNILVTVQVALAFVLLICSGLMIRTFRALTMANPGFTRPAELQTFRVYIPKPEVPKDEDVPRMEQQILQKIAAIPGVSSVGFSSNLAMSVNEWSDPVFAEGQTYTREKIPAISHFNFDSPEFLETMGTPLVAGRNFTWAETMNKIPVALVSLNLAREYWGSAAKAIGKRIRPSNIDDWREVIGVVDNVRCEGMTKPACRSVYWPVLNAKLDSNPILVPRSVSFAIRSSRSGSQAFMEEVRRAVWSVDASLPLANVHTMDYFYTKSMARTSFTLVMLGIAGGMALLLAIVGLYGVVAYSVSQRTREIGIRMALGAQQNNLTRMFVRQGLVLVGIGVACGLVAAFGVIRLMSSLLFGVRPGDPVTYIAVTIGLVATAAIASYLPSRRAASVDPVEALRGE